MNIRKTKLMLVGQRSRLVVGAFLVTFGLVACADDSRVADFTVYKNPQCMCCDKWAEHMRHAGYSVSLAPTPYIAEIKQKYAIEPKLQSCHTTVHNQTGLVFEGHVPIKHVVSLVENPLPGARGLAVPGMPVGSPGMEVGDRKDPYHVLLLSENAEPTVFARENMADNKEHD